MDDTGKKNDFVTREIAAARQLLEAVEEWRSLVKEWQALDYASHIVDADIEGDNEHVTAAMLGMGFYTFSEIETLLSSGHYTNLYNLT